MQFYPSLSVLLVISVRLEICPFLFFSWSLCVSVMFALPDVFLVMLSLAKDFAPTGERSSFSLSLISLFIAFGVILIFLLIFSDHFGFCVFPLFASFGCLVLQCCFSVFCNYLSVLGFFGAVKYVLCRLNPG